MAEGLKRSEFIYQSLAALAVPGVGSTFFRQGHRLETRSALRPNPLRPGDTLGLVSPAGRVYEEKVYTEMEEALKGMGYTFRYGPHARNSYGYLAGTDRERAEDLNRFFQDPEIDGILCIRGGWGCNRILPHVDFDQIRQNPKFFGGFSDITSLHLSIYHRTGLNTFHSPNGTSDWTPFTRKSFQEMVSGDENARSIPPEEYHSTSFETLRSGEGEGVLLGGNLSLVCSLIGTPYFPDLTNAILFVEDIGEDVYRIDRMMSQLALSGHLDQLSGFLFGTCMDCRPTGRASLSLQQVLTDYLGERAYPSCFGLPFGHVSDNMTIPVGVKARFNADNGRITLMEPLFES